MTPREKYTELGGSLPATVRCRSGRSHPAHAFPPAYRRGDAITPEKLRMIEGAEAYLASLGIEQLRARLHGNMARIEVYNVERGKILVQQSAVVRSLKALSLTYVTPDPEGYRSGWTKC